MKTQDPTFGLPLALESSWIEFQPLIGTAPEGSIFLSSRGPETVYKQSLALATNKQGDQKEKQSFGNSYCGARPNVCVWTHDQGLLHRFGTPVQSHLSTDTCP